MLQETILGGKRALSMDEPVEVIVCAAEDHSRGEQAQSVDEPVEVIESVLQETILERIRAQSVETLVPQPVSQSIEVFLNLTQFRNLPQMVEEMGEDEKYLLQDPILSHMKHVFSLLGRIKAILDVFRHDPLRAPYRDFLQKASEAVTARLPTLVRSSASFDKTHKKITALTRATNRADVRSSCV